MPTVAIETVYVWNNTSIVQDEVLAQRLGLIPLAIDPRKLQLKQCKSIRASARSNGLIEAGAVLRWAAAEDAPTDLNTVVFNLVARCERRKDVRKGETDPTKIWHGTEGTKEMVLPARSRSCVASRVLLYAVLSSQIAFEPKGSQNELFGNSPPKPAVEGILLAKMRGGQVRVSRHFAPGVPLMFCPLYLLFTCPRLKGDRSGAALQQGHR